MAKEITTHKKIKTARDSLKASATEMKKAVNSIVSSYNTKGGAAISNNADAVAKALKNAESHLTEAHLMANALGGVKSKPKAENISFKINTCSSRSMIMINYANAHAGVTAISKCKTGFSDLSKQIDTCCSEINSINVTEQLVSSLTIIDFLLPIVSGLSKGAAILHIKNTCLSELKKARTEVDKITSYCLGFSKITGSLNRFAGCEDSVKQRTYADMLQTTSQITEESNTPEGEIRNRKAELEKKQSEYVMMFGVESKAIADEIARLKKLYQTKYINLQPNMGSYSMKQGNYGAFTIPWGYNAGCCATAYAIGLSITKGKPYNPTSFWNQKVGSTYYTAGGVGGYKSFDASKVYEALKKGKPTMFHYKYTSKYGSNQHWVLINGIREGADPDKLTYKDFIVIDPATGKERSLADVAKSYTKFSIQGMKVFK